jgi:hypothetical protein
MSRLIVPALATGIALAALMGATTGPAFASPCDSAALIAPEYVEGFDCGLASRPLN